jgi:tetratricopeptide (TPR) repeat protein
VVSGKIIWFYLGKDVWPCSLNIAYPTWKMNPAAPAAWLPLAVLGVVFLLAWRFRHGWGRPLLFGLGAFVILLFPVLGFFAGQYQTWFQVSDHLQYLAMLAPVALGTACLVGVLGTTLFRLAAPVLIVSLALVSFHRAEVFSHEESLMRDCLAKNPAAWGAETDLGTLLAQRQDYAGAIACFKTALTDAPADEAANLDLGHALTLQGDFTQAEPCLLQAIKTKPLDPEAHRQYAEMLARQGRVPEAIRHLQIALALKPDPETRLRYAALLFQTGAVRPAEEQLRQVVQAKPNTPEALNNLAWLLATSADEQLRNGPEAVRYAEKACALTGYKQAGLVGTLAAAYAEAGRFPEAVKNCQLTIELANAAGQGGFAAVNQQLLALYQSGRPYHTAPSPGQ